MAGRISVSTGGKLYFKRVQRNGAVQRAFAKVIGIPVGNCLKGKIPRGSHPGRAAVMQAIKDCAPPKQKGMLQGAIATERGR